MLQFQDHGHVYQSIVPDGIHWISTSTLISALKQKFNQAEKAAKCSVRKPGKYKNKWYGIPPVQILEAWKSESERSIKLGKWYHSKQEQELYNTSQELNVYIPTIQGTVKIAGEQRLGTGIYPEHLCYLESAGICGQADYVGVNKNNKLTIKDYKTNKEVRRKGFTNWEGITTKMLKPVQYLEECEYNTYSLQLSIYAYMIMRYNPLMELQDLIIEHVTFEIEGEDKYQYPIYRVDNKGEPVVKAVEKIKVPYMEKEVKSIIQWIKEPHNRQLVINHG